METLEKVLVEIGGRIFISKDATYYLTQQFKVSNLVLLNEICGNFTHIHCNWVFLLTVTSL
jgi:hypothetical protein